MRLTFLSFLPRVPLLLAHATAADLLIARIHSSSLPLRPSKSKGDARGRTATIVGLYELAAYHSGGQHCAFYCILYCIFYSIIYCLFYCLFYCMIYSPMHPSEAAPFKGLLPEVFWRIFEEEPLRCLFLSYQNVCA